MPAVSPWPWLIAVCAVPLLRRTCQQWWWIYCYSLTRRRRGLHRMVSSLSPRGRHTPHYHSLEDDLSKSHNIAYPWAILIVKGWWVDIPFHPFHTSSSTFVNYQTNDDCLFIHFSSFDITLGVCHSPWAGFHYKLLVFVSIKKIEYAGRDTWVDYAAAAEACCFYLAAIAGRLVAANFSIADHRSMTVSSFFLASSSSRK